MVLVDLVAKDSSWKLVVVFIWSLADDACDDVDDGNRIEWHITLECL